MHMGFNTGVAAGKPVLETLCIKRPPVGQDQFWSSKGIPQKIVFDKY